jgi:hypothetical protein
VVEPALLARLVALAALVLPVTAAMTTLGSPPA